MNFVIYCHIFPHISIILVVITIILNDFGDFLNNPLSSGFNSVWQKRPSVSIFDFSGATGLGIEQTQSPRFRIFQTDDMDLLNEAKGAGKMDRGPVARPPPWARHQVSKGLPRPVSRQFSCHRLGLT